MTARARRGSPTSDELAAAWEKLGRRECILEALVDFQCEISAIVARGLDGATRCFPIGLNDHRDGILRTTTVPSGLPAEDPGRRPSGSGVQLADSLDLVGLVALEMFVTRDGRVLVNEMAPRPHNSGHWTIDACATSQFEQLVRAICGLPLGAGRRAGAVAHEEPDRRRGQRLAALPRRPDGAAASLRQGQGAARPQDGPRHLRARRPPSAPVHDLTWAFSFSKRITSSMRRSRKPQVASLPGERSFSQ